MSDGVNGFCQLGRFEAEALQSLTCGEFRVYVVIATARNHKTLKTPAIGYALIAKMCGMDKETTRKLIARLVSKGALTKEPRGKRFVFGFPIAAGLKSGTHVPH